MKNLFSECVSITFCFNVPSTYPQGHSEELLININKHKPRRRMKKKPGEVKLTHSDLPLILKVMKHLKTDSNQNKERFWLWQLHEETPKPRGRKERIREGEGQSLNRCSLQQTTKCSKCEPHGQNKQRCWVTNISPLS